jgi:glycosyltransferase involved in cell wall biosynthesis
MNIFHIPSWYPSSNNEFSGIFIKDFIHNFAKEYPENNHMVSLFSNTNYYLNPRNPIKSYLNYLIDDSIFYKKNIGSNIQYYYTSKSISIPPIIDSRISNKIIEVNKKNLISAITEYGKIDLIHAHVTYPAGQIANKLSQDFKIPFIITEHFGPFPQTGLKINNRLKNSIYTPLKNASQIVAVSNHLVNSIKEFGNFKISLIPNFVNEDEFVIKKFPKELNSPFIFYTQCLMNGKRKGIDTLLNSIKKLTNLGYNAKFRIGGNGTELNNYKKIANNLNLDIDWLGTLTREDIINEYNCADSFILTSYHENFGIVFAESIACGTPIIASNSGGPSDIVNEMNGLLIPLKNIDETVKAMIYMINNIEKYKPNDIRNDYLTKFSKKAVFTMYHDLYNSLKNKF